MVSEGRRLWDTWVALAADGAMVGRTGISVDVHAAMQLGIPGRNGHHEWFHLFDLSAKPLSRYGASAKKGADRPSRPETESSSEDSSSSSSDGTGGAQSRTEGASGSGDRLAAWQRLQRQLRRLFRYGQAGHAQLGERMCMWKQSKTSAARTKIRELPNLSGPHSAAPNISRNEGGAALRDSVPGPDPNDSIQRQLFETKSSPLFCQPLS